jgi:transketolase
LRRIHVDLARAAIDAVAKDQNAATRASSGKVINALAKHLEGLVGGSADLAESTKTLIAGEGYFGRVERGQSPSARNLAFGVREHAMGAIVNGLALWGGFIPYGATFLTFSDYMRPPIRLAALMKLRSVFVFTHDSIYLGEDGPTHQAVEHVWALRLIPGLDVWRPADALETAMAWTYAVSRGPSRPHALCLTRQNLPAIPRPVGFDPDRIVRGGYVVRDAEGARGVLVATGSEVHVALEAAAQLAADGVEIRVVSMPCLERFRGEDAAYRASVLPPGLPVATFEAGRTFPWAELTGAGAVHVGVDTFGESAPADQLQRHFRLDAASVAARLRAAFAG